MEQNEKNKEVEEKIKNEKKINELNVIVDKNNKKIIFEG